MNRCGRGEDLPILDDVLSAKGWWRIPAPGDEGPLRAVRGPHVWLHRHPQQPVVLRMEYDGWNARRPGGPLHFSYALATPDGELIEVLDATWADWDFAGRLVYTVGGRVYARQMGAGPATDVVPLADFSADVPAPVIAPGWATEWPRPATRSAARARRPRSRPGNVE